MRFDEGFRADIVVESKAIVERKSVERIAYARKKPLPTYSKPTGMKRGHQPNFGEYIMKRGIARTIDGLPE